MDVYLLEKKFPQVEKLRVNNLDAWPILRILIGFELAKKDYRAVEEIDHSTTSRLRRLVQSLMGWRKMLGKTGKFKYIIFTNLLEKRINKQKYYDRLFHSTVRLLGSEKVLLVDYCEGETEKIRSTYYGSVVNGDLVNYLSVLFSFLVPIKISKGDRGLIEEVLKAAGVRVDYESYFKGFMIKAWIYKKIFRFIKPQCVFAGCYTYYAQVFAAKKLNIPVVEYQHGLVNNSHRGYRTLLPYKRQYTSDFLFSFGEDILQNLDESVYERNRIRPVGFSYFELLEEGFYDKVIIEKGNFEITICIPTDSIVENELINFACNAAAYLPFVLFIINPRGGLSSAGKEKIERLENIRCSFAPFQVLIQQCDFNLTIASTCAFESLYFGIPNLLYNANGLARKIYQGLLDENSFSFFFENEKELASFLKTKPVFNKDEIKKAGSRFYSSGHTAKVRMALESIIDQR